MPRSIIRTMTTAIAIAIAALAAPTALARPADKQQPRTAAIDGYSERPMVDHPSAPRSAAIDGYSERPMSDQPPGPPISRPDTTPTAAVDSGIAWTTIGLGIAGSLIAVGAIAGITRRTRRARIAA
jgi:hypothetical protein